MAGHGLVRYWIVFEGDPLTRWQRSFGVTAIDLEDALKLISARIASSPGEIESVIENVDVSSLDDHVRPNMTPPIWRGVWFPASSESVTVGSRTP